MRGNNGNHGNPKDNLLDSCQLLDPPTLLFREVSMLTIVLDLKSIRLINNLMTRHLEGRKSV